MECESEICRRYAAELAEIAALDRGYYLNEMPTPADRAGYVRRQAQLERVRLRFYGELSMARHSEPMKPGTFRVVVNDRLIGEPVMSAPQCRVLHDLNNFLGVVIGRCELLADFVSKDAGAVKHLSAILDASRNMAERIHGGACPNPESSSKKHGPCFDTREPNGLAR